MFYNNLEAGIIITIIIIIVVAYDLKQLYNLFASVWSFEVCVCVCVCFLFTKRNKTFCTICYTSCHRSQDSLQTRKHSPKVSCTSLNVCTVGFFWRHLFHHTPSFSVSRLHCGKFLCFEQAVMLGKTVNSNRMPFPFFICWHEKKNEEFCTSGMFHLGGWALWIKS